jgi:hypothetical protein
VNTAQKVVLIVTAAVVGLILVFGQCAYHEQRVSFAAPGARGGVGYNIVRVDDFNEVLAAVGIATLGAVLVAVLRKRRPS